LGNINSDATGFDIIKRNTGSGKLRDFSPLDASEARDFSPLQYQQIGFSENKTICGC
jgi:hypothetical protein